MAHDETAHAVRKGSGVWDRDRDPDEHACLEDWLEQQAADPWMQQIAERTLALLSLDPGMTILEVGCGTGVFLPVLARAVSPTGQVVGIDHSEAFLADARRRLIKASCAASVTLQQADAYRLPFADARFDAAHAEHVLEHLGDPDTALREMIRVVKPGGRIVVGEPHLLGTQVDHPDPEGVHLVLAHGYRRFRSPRIGLELNRRMAEAGLVNRTIDLFTRLITELDPQQARVFAEIATEMAVEGILTRARADALVTYLEEASQDGYFSSYYPFFLVAGCVPST